MMAPNCSRQVRSSQKTVHARLEKLLESHLASEWRQPLHQPSVQAFEALEPLLAGSSGRLSRG